MEISRKVKAKKYWQQFLSINKFWNDLKTLTHLSKVLLIICLLLFSIGLFFNFNIIFDSTQHWFPFLNNKDLPIWRQILLPLTNFTFFLTVIYFILKKEDKTSSYFCYVMTIITSGLVALAFGYLGTFQFNILFLFPLQIVNFMNLAKRKWTIRSRRIVITWYHHLLFLSMIILLTSFGFFEIKLLAKFVFHISDWDSKAIVILLDSLTVAISVIASILMIKKIKYQWFFWIIVYLLQIIMYSFLANHVNIIMILTWLIFLINGFYQAYKCWK